MSTRKYIIHCYLTCKRVQTKAERGKQARDTTTTRQCGCIPSRLTTKQQTLLAPTNPWDQLLGGTTRNWAIWFPKAPSPGPNGADWSHFTTGPMQPAEQNKDLNKAELVAQSPEAHYKDQRTLCCLRPGEQGGQEGTLTAHKPLSETVTSFKYSFKSQFCSLQK